MTIYNKVTINNQTLIDLSSDSVTPNTLLNGVTAHDNSGASITGTYVPSGGATINNQNKTVRPSEEEQSITADNGYTGLGTVTIEAIDDEYIGSAIDRRDETDLTSTNNVVTVPAGYYAEEETKTIAAISHTAPTISINTSTGVITATHVQGGGYVSEDTQTATENLSIQAAATIIPSSSAQTAVAANKYTTGAVTVAAVPTETKSITANGTYTPATGKYFSSVTVNVPSVNISQDANGYIVLDDESGYGGGGGGYLYEESSTVSTNEVWNSPLMANNLATGGYLEAEIVFSAQTNYPNIISIGTKRTGGLAQWSTTDALHFYFSSDRNVFVVRQSSVSTDSQAVDPTVPHVLKVDKDYAYVDGVPVVALNSTILNASALMIGSAEGSKRFTGTFNYIRYK